MAQNGEVALVLTIRTDAASAEAGIKKFAETTKTAGTAVEDTTRRITTQTGAYAALMARIDPVFRAQQQLEKGERVLTGAFEAGRISAEQKARALDTLRTRLDQTTGANTRMNASVGGLNGGFAKLATGFSAVNGMLATFGVALSAVALISYGKHVFETVGGLGELAEQLGVTTDALQALQFAGAQAGVKTEQLETGISKLTRTIGEAGEGTDTAIKAFSKLGVGILDSSGKIRSTEAVLSDVAIAMSKMNDPAARAAAAVDLFGKSGQRMLPLLTEIAERGLPAMIAGAKDLGAVVDRELIDAFDKASDRMARFGMQATVAAAELMSYAAKVAAFAVKSFTGGDISEQIVAKTREIIAAEKQLEALRERHAGSRVLEQKLAGQQKIIERLKIEEEALLGVARAEAEVARARAQQPAAAVASGTSNPKSTQAIDAEGKALEKLKNDYVALQGAVDPVVKANLEFVKQTETLRKAIDAGLVPSLERQEQLYSGILAAREDAIEQADKAGAATRKEAADQDKRNTSLERYIAGLEDEARAVSLGVTERKTSEALRQAETKLLDEAGNKTRDLTAAERERIRQSVEGRDAWEKQTKAAEDYAKELERVVGRTTDRMVDFGADAFFDALEGRRDDFWASMVTTAKRAFAQMAAEALLRPIFLPIVQGLVGGAPGAFGVQGVLGSAAQGAAQSAGSSLFGGSNPISSLLQGVQQMFSPNNFIAAAFPSLFGSGGVTLGSAGFVGAEIAGAAGGITAGAAPLAAMAPFLPILAIALPLLLSFFMGGKKSVGPNGNAIINFERDADGRLTNPNGLAIGGLGSDNGGDREFARKMAEGATKAVNTIVDRIGGRMTGMPGAGISGQLELGYFQEGGKFFSIVGGTKAEFGSADEAVADFAKRTLQAATITGMSPDVQLALSRTVASSLEDLGKDVDFAFGFRRQVDLAAAGPDTRQGQALGFRYAAADNASQQRLALRDFVADARRLFGDDSAQLADAKTTARNRALAMVGLGPDAYAEGNKPLEGMAAQIAATREQFHALKETLIDTGLSAVEAQAKIDEGLQRTFQRIAADQDKAVTDAILAAESPGAAGAKALAESQKKRRADYVAAHVAGGSTIQEAALFRLERLEAGAALIGLTAAQLDEVAAALGGVGQMTQPMRAALEQARAFADFVAGFGAMQVDIARWNFEAQQTQTAIAEAEQEAADAKAAYVEALNREIAAVSGQIQATEQLKGNFERLAQSMRDTRLGLLIDPNLSPLNPQDRLAEARSQFESIYARAQLGDAAAMEQLPGISRSFLESSKAFNASNPAYFADFSRVQEALQNTETIAERQVRIADEQLDTLNGQLDVLRSQLAEAEGQSDDIRTVAEAAALWREAERRAQAARDGTDGNAARIAGEQLTAFRGLAGNFQTLTAGAASQAERDQIYQATASQRDALLGSITDVATLQQIGQIYYRGDNRDSGAIFLRSRLYSLGAVPQFEYGGQHAGGLRLVGERGMELEATGPARYFSTDATIEMLRRSGPGANDGALLAAVRTMCQLLAEGNGISREAARAMVARLDDLVDGQGDDRGSLAEERARAA